MTRRHRVSLSRLLEAGVDHQETIDARWTDLIKAIWRLIWRRKR